MYSDYFIFIYYFVLILRNNIRPTLFNALGKMSLDNKQEIQCFRKNARGSQVRFTLHLSICMLNDHSQIAPK